MKRAVNVMWRRPDETDSNRVRQIVVDVPVMGDTTPLQDAILGIPEDTMSGSDWDSAHQEYTARKLAVCLTDPQQGPPTDEQCIDNILAETARYRAKKIEEQKQDEARATRDQEEKKREETRRAELRQQAIAAFSDGTNPDIGALYRYLRWGGYNGLTAVGDQLTPSESEILRQRIVARDTAEDEAAEQRKQEKAREKGAHEAAVDAEVAMWAKKHGSEHLREQIAQGFNGWSLYIRERLDTDFAGLPDVELDRDGENKPAKNPSVNALALRRRVAERLVALGQAATVEDGIKQTRIQKITIELDGGEEYENEPDVGMYVALTYRMGSDIMPTRDIRFRADE